MEGVYLRIFVNRFQKHKGELLYEWLLERAKSMGIEGGSAFQSIAGFGAHGVLHEEHFYELGSNVPVMVSFALEKEEANRFLADLEEEKVDAFYVHHPSTYGHIYKK